MEPQTNHTAPRPVLNPVAVAAAVPKDSDELQAAFGPSRRLARQQYLFRAGETCAGIYRVQQGSIKVSTLSPSGDEQIVRFYLPGEVLGLEALGEPRHSSSAVALEESRVQALSVPALHALCQQSPALSRRVLQLVSQRIAELQEHMLMLGRKTAAERLAAFLTNLTRRTRTQELTLTMSRDAIGSYLGITLETVSRLLHKFQKDRLIVLHGRRIALVAPARLQELADGGLAHAA